MSDPRFYVYEHWRPDLDACFWVGKGTGDRAYRFRRNIDYDCVVSALANLGMCVEVRLVASGLTEIEAYRREEERVDFWKKVGVVLTNRSRGGRGNRSDLVRAETREKLRVANLGKKASPETRAKMSASQLRREKKAPGRRPGYAHSPETIAKMRTSQTGRPVSDAAREKLRNANLGKTHSAETKAKMSRRRVGNTWGRGGRGLKRSEETKRRMSDAQRGKLVSAETREKISATLKKRALKIRVEPQ